MTCLQLSSLVEGRSLSTRGLNDGTCGGTSDQTPRAENRRLAVAPSAVVMVRRITWSSQR